MSSQRRHQGLTNSREQIRPYRHTQRASTLADMQRARMQAISAIPDLEKDLRTTYERKLDVTAMFNTGSCTVLSSLFALLFEDLFA